MPGYPGAKPEGDIWWISASVSFHSLKTHLVERLCLIAKQVDLIAAILLMAEPKVQLKNGSALP